MRLLILTSVLSVACEGELYTDREWERLESLVNVDQDPAPDPVNKYVGDPTVAALGQMFFFDTRFSGIASGRDVLGRPMTASRAPVGEPLGIACATCHDPQRGGIDHTSVPGHVSIGAGLYDVNAESVINAAYYDLKYWNGRYDSLVWQAIAVTESGVSMNSDRLRVAWTISDHYADLYRAAFPEYDLPAFGSTFEEQAALLEENGQCRLDGGACPSDRCVEDQGCWPKFPLHARGTRDNTCFRAEAFYADFDCVAEPEVVVRTFVNFAKAIAAYEFTLVSRNAAFDRWVTEGRDSELISVSARRGAKLFVGKASCVDCHNTPLFSDGKFHNVGVPQTGVGVPTEADCPAGAPCDCTTPGKPCAPWGAYYGLGSLKITPFKVTDADYSDTPGMTERLRPWYELELTDDLKGAWRTPSLRDVAITAPYMHDGYYRSLDEVVHHYQKGGTPLGSASDQIDPRIRPLELSEDEIHDLLEFLKTLTGEALPTSRVIAPELP